MNGAAATEDSTPKATYIDTQPIVVTATRTTQPLSQAASSLSVLTEQDIQEDQPVTLGELLLDIPNVDVLDFAYISSQISIRGSNSSQITYLIDGMRQDDQTMAGNRPSGIFIDPEILKQVEVKHGGGSALYGNGGSAELLVLPATGRTVDFHHTITRALPGAPKHIGRSASRPADAYDFAAFRLKASCAAA